MRQIVVLRHGHRSAIKHCSFGNEQPLTMEGKKAAARLGKSMRDIAWGEIHTSPVLRCVQTATEFLKGTGQKTPIILSHVLGDPGIFIENCEKAGHLFLSRPLEEIIQLIADRKMVDGMRSLEDGGKIFLDYVAKISKFPCLMISHDIIICLLCCFFFKSRDVKKYLPNFLEGFCIEVEQKTIYEINCSNENSQSYPWLSL